LHACRVLRGRLAGLRWMPEMDEGQMSERVYPQRLGAIPEVSIFAAPAHESLVVTAYAIVGFTRHGQRSTSGGVLEDGFGHGMARNHTPCRQVRRGLPVEREDEPLEVDDVESRPSLREEVTRIDRRDEHVVVVK